MSPRVVVDFHFEDPWVLALLGALLVGAALNLRRRRREGGGLLFSSLALLPAGRETWRARLRWTLVPLRVAALVLLTIALARPQLALASYELTSEGIDIGLALDVSSSMTSRDFGGRRRIDAVKKVLTDFVGGLKNDRAGIVIFADETLLLSPLTLDHAALQKVIEPIEAGRPLRDGTAIGTGLAATLNVLRDSRARSKIAVLLTDGENNSGTITPLDAAEAARLLGVRVYTIGAVGSMNSVDERLMRRISETTGGQYYRASDEGSLLEIYRDIEQLEKSRVGTRGRTALEDMYLIFLVPGVVLLLVEMLLGASLLRRTP